MTSRVFIFLAINHLPILIIVHSVNSLSLPAASMHAGRMMHIVMEVMNVNYMVRCVMKMVMRH